MTVVEGAPQIRAVDLFCGAGGLTHGLLQAGIQVTTGVDLDPACRYPYERNNESRFLQCDVNELTSSSVAKMIDGSSFSLIAGGPPCQPFSKYSQSSKNNRQRGDWQLVRQFGALVGAVKPDFVVMENVPQLLAHPVFEKFLMELTGYSVKWSVVEANCLGVPQTRKRLVVIASRLGPEGLTVEQRCDGLVTVRDAIGHLRPIEAGEADPKDRLHVSSRLSETNLKRIRHSKPGGTWRDWPRELQVACHRKETGATYPSVYGRMSWDEAAPTITTQCFGYGNGRFGHPDQDRAISLREAAILQTFPPEYRFVPPGESPKFSVLGRLIGNAVPVRLGKIIGELILAHAASSSQSER